MVLYGFVLMFGLRPDRFTPAEILLHIWIGGFFFQQLQEFVQLLRGTSSKQFMFRSVKAHMLKPFWQKLELAALGSHLVGLILRIAMSCRWITRSHFDIVRVIFCLSGMLFYFKVLRAYMASSYLGPKLFVIRRMIRDVLMFLLIIVVFMLAYAITAQALQYPNRPFYPAIFTELLYYPYWQLYGEISLDETIHAQVEGCTNGSLQNAAGDWCPRNYWFIPVVLGIYLLIGNILLVNMLIAIFTHVFDEVQANSVVIWKYEMLTLAIEFDNMPVMAFPFAIVEQFFHLLHFLFTCGGSWKKRHDYTVRLTPKQTENMQVFEKECLNEVLRYKRQCERTEINSQIAKAHQKLDSLHKRLEEDRKLFLGSGISSGGGVGSLLADSMPPYSRQTSLPATFQSTARRSTIVEQPHFAFKEMALEGEEADGALEAIERRLKVLEMNSPRPPADNT